MHDVHATLRPLPLHPGCCQPPHPCTQMHLARVPHAPRLGSTKQLPQLFPHIPLVFQKSKHHKSLLPTAAQRSDKPRQQWQQQQAAAGRQRGRAAAAVAGVTHSWSSGKKGAQKLAWKHGQVFGGGKKKLARPPRRQPLHWSLLACNARETLNHKHGDAATVLPAGIRVFCRSWPAAAAGRAGRACLWPANPGGGQPRCSVGDLGHCWLAPHAPGTPVARHHTTLAHRSSDPCFLHFFSLLFFSSFPSSARRIT